MSRVIINAHPDLEYGSVALVLAEPMTDDGWTMTRFQYQPADPIPAGFANGTLGTKEMGAYIAQGLRTHPAISRELDKLLGAAPDAASSPLYIHISAGTESLPWETLFDNEAFLALDQRWPVARMGGGPGDVTVVDFEPPLRVMAILGAARVPAAEEWDALFAGLQRAGFPVAVKALVAEQSVEDQIKASAHPNVAITVGGIPPGRDIITEIEDFRPNLLHFFSHGRSNHGFSEIQVATRSSWPSDDDPGHIVLEPKAFQPLTALQPPWVVTMNVCRGAQPGGAGSLAFSLLGAGFPAVVGMREPVSERVAHAFAKGFYRSLIRRLNQADDAGTPLDLDLASVLYEPRMEICEAVRDTLSCREAASVQREWALPVLYIRGSGQRIRRRATAPVAPGAAQPEPPGDGPGEQPAEGPGEPPAAAAPTDRTTLESKLAFLKDIVGANLPGMDEAAIEAMTTEIKRLEVELYGQPADGPA